jgi:hypothetical protein
MRTWTRVAVPATLCGGCNRELHRGDPVLVIEVTYQPKAATERTIGRTGRVVTRVRCDRCEGPAPPDLPALVEQNNAITPRPMTKFHPVLPLGTPLADFRARQSGEREPGEDG